MRSVHKILAELKDLGVEIVPKSRCEWGKYRHVGPVTVRELENLGLVIPTPDPIYSEYQIRSAQWIKERCLKRLEECEGTIKRHQTSIRNRHREIAALKSRIAELDKRIA